MGFVTKDTFISDFEITLPGEALILTSGNKYTFNLKKPIVNKFNKYGNLKVKHGVNYLYKYTKQR